MYNVGGEPRDLAGNEAYCGASLGGGLLIMVAAGNITNAGTISCDGTVGGNGGGSSGGGNATLIFGGTHANTGTERANGGAAGPVYHASGGAGGAGSVSIRTFAQVGWT